MGSEGLIGKCVVTGQEVPSTERSLREDLYKKHMTGEPFACRPNYTVLTRLICIIGWKRFEMNQSLTFQGVGKKAKPTKKEGGRDQVAPPNRRQGKRTTTQWRGWKAAQPKRRDHPKREETKQHHVKG